MSIGMTQHLNRWCLQNRLMFCSAASASEEDKKSGSHHGYHGWYPRPLKRASQEKQGRWAAVVAQTWMLDLKLNELDGLLLLRVAPPSFILHREKYWFDCGLWFYCFKVLSLWKQFGLKLPVFQCRRASFGESSKEQLHRLLLDRRRSGRPSLPRPQ